MRLSTFQRLALATTVATYLLILVGGLVRASGAGLGCPDWPKCFGSWIPPASTAALPPEFDRSLFNPVLMWTEYLNRLLGVTVGFLIFATLVLAIRDHRRSPRILWPSALAFVLVGFQGWLGGVVVQQELAAWIVTVHLVVALIIVSLLLYATLVAFFPESTHASTRRRPAFTWTAILLVVTTLAQVTLGAQVRGRIDDALAAGTSRAKALSTVGTYDLWHRELSLAVFGLAIVLLVLTWKRQERAHALVRSTYALVALILLQLGLGVGLAYVGLTPAVQVAHLTGASLVLGAATITVLLARWLP